jgi:hypothetical protein
MEVAMKPLRWLPALPLLLVAVAAAPADDTKDKSGFVPMFNGRDLTGWVNVNCAPSTFYVKDSEIITTGHPTGYLRTTKQYENFIAEFDWMHVPPQPGAVGNSGFFVWCDPIPAVGTGYTRGIEVQVLVNLTYKNKKGEITATSQGDLFSIHGAKCVPDRPHPDGWERCLPDGNYCKGEREWNHYRVEGNDGRITLAVNGHVVSGVSKCNPRKGYLALESEGSECHFKNLKIKELPSTHPKKDEIADEDQGFKNLYTGLDLSGWKADDEVRAHWQPRDTVLHYDGKAERRGRELRSEKEYGDAEFIVDFRTPPKPGEECRFTFRDGDQAGVSLGIGSGIFGASMPRWVKVSDNDSYKNVKPAGQWNRLRVKVEDAATLALVNGRVILAGKRKPSDPVRPKDAPAKGPLVLRPDVEMDFANLFVRELK